MFLLVIMPGNVFLHSVVSDDKEISAAEKSLMKKVLADHIINVKSDVEVQQKDPNSPLYSVKTFEELRLYVTVYS